MREILIKDERGEEIICENQGTIVWKHEKVEKRLIWHHDGFMYVRRDLMGLLSTSCRSVSNESG